MRVRLEIESIGRRLVLIPESDSDRVLLHSLTPGTSINPEPFACSANIQYGGNPSYPNNVKQMVVEL